MLYFLPPPMRGVLTLALMGLNTLLWALPIFAVTLLRFLVPVERWKRACARAATSIAENWIRGNNFFFHITQRTQWQMQGLEELKRQDWYLVIANHQTWIDIFVLQRAFIDRIPFLKFFIKQELIWFPIMGQVWWALDYPFMKRYSRAYLEKHPEKRGEDLETTRRQCAKFQHAPVSMLNFVEGTRFTPQKRAQQQSPYHHLLKPKAGGMAFTLAAMNGRLRTLLNVTIVYPDGRPSFWQFLCGQVHRIILRAECVTIPETYMQGDYMNDDAFRTDFQAWVRTLWEEKDRQIGALLGELVTASRT